MKQYRRLFIHSIVLLWIVPFVTHLPVFSQASENGEAVLAKAGDVFIGEREFIERFELTPGLYRHRKPQLEGEKLTFLYSLIAEKLLAQEAVARHLDQDSVFKESFRDIVKMIARDELYRREVRAKVTVSGEEIRRGVKRALKVPFVEYLFFSNDTDAKFVLPQIAKQHTFGDLVIDSSFDVVRDTASVLWGEADAAIESTAYALRDGQISGVVQAGDGFYILHRLRTSPNAFYVGMQQNVLRERVADKIQTRKERKRSEEIAGELLRGQVGFSPPEIFKQFAQTMTDIAQRHEQSPQMVLTGEMRSELVDSCKAILDDTLIVAGQQRWTTRSAIDRLYLESFAVPSGQTHSIPHRIYDQFRTWVTRELLEQVALHRGLDTTAEVQRLLEAWRQQFLATMMKNDIGKHVTVSDQELYEHLKQSDTAAIPMVKLRVLRTATLDDMREALSELEHGSKLEDVIERWSSDSELRKNRGVLGPFPITDHPPLGELASHLDVGEQYGPMQDSSGASAFFEVLEKQSHRSTGWGKDSSRYTNARREVLRMKQRRAVTMFIARIADERGFSIFQDRLRALQVTSTPMLAYRFLGFGGRMFAVPFVDQQTDWLDTETPSVRVQP